jgi:rRNA processing protein Gar1
LSRVRSATAIVRSEVAVVRAVTPSGIVTARSNGTEFPVEGNLVSTATGFHGVVSRVFGPVARPYLAIRPRRPLKASEAAALVGQVLTSRM